jgi:hypothetical protein
VQTIDSIGGTARVHKFVATTREKGLRVTTVRRRNWRRADVLDGAAGEASGYPLSGLASRQDNPPEIVVERRQQLADAPHVLDLRHEGSTRSRRPRGQIGSAPRVNASFKRAPRTGEIRARLGRHRRGCGVRLAVAA